VTRKDSKAEKCNSRTDLKDCWN